MNGLQLTLTFKKSMWNTPSEYKDLSRANINNLISQLPLTKYLKENYGMTPNNWAFWSAGSISKGRLNFSSDGDLDKNFCIDSLSIKLKYCSLNMLMYLFYIIISIN